MITEPFFLRALLAGIGIALVAGPLGCFLVWRRMAFFGDTMAHASLLGVALGLLLGVHLTAGVIAVTVATALVLAFAERQRTWLPGDTLLGILSHGTLSFGLVALGLMAWVRVDLLGFLFGDILSVTLSDLVVVYLGGAAVLAALMMMWRPLLALTVHEDLAIAEGVPVLPLRLGLMLLLAIVIGLAMKIIGILLITALLIIPAATARRFAATPERMAVVAAGIGVAAVVAGLLGSLTLDIASGPSIVVAATLMFITALAGPGRHP